MSNHNPTNERVKRRYFDFLKDANGYSEASVDAVASALARFDRFTRHRDFKNFHVEQAIAFKKYLAEPKDGRGKSLSKATRYAVQMHLKRFFQWLSREAGYKSRMSYSDASYFNLTDGDARVAGARREHPGPTLEQVRHAIACMPAGTDIERRNRAVLALALLTGARDSALASLKLKHVDLRAGCIYQDAREVRTKFSKSFTTYFFPVGDEILAILSEWVEFLRNGKLFGEEDPLFPATAVGPGATLQFAALGLKRTHWSTATPIRTIFRDAFTCAGLPYFNPHSIRKTLVALGESVCRTPEEFKAWSQNLGHEGVLTTFLSYGNVATRRQGELIHGLSLSNGDGDAMLDALRLAQAIAQKLSVANPGRRDG